MDQFAQLFGNFVALVYHCFDRIVITGYLSGLFPPGAGGKFLPHGAGIPVISKEVLRQRSADYQNWVEAFARNHGVPIEWAEIGERKEDDVLPRQRRMASFPASSRSVRAPILPTSSTVAIRTARSRFRSGTEPIVLHRDAVSGGGYFMIGTVIAADMNQIGQMQPHTPTQFIALDMPQALQARQQAGHRLSLLRRALA